MLLTLHLNNLKEIAYIALKVDGKFSKKQEGNTTIKVGVNFSKKDNKGDSCYVDLSINMENRRKMMNNI